MSEEYYTAIEAIEKAIDYLARAKSAQVDDPNCKAVWDALWDAQSAVGDAKWRLLAKEQNAINEGFLKAGK